MLTVVTGWSPAGWVQYGKLFLHTFLKFWPADQQLVVYVEYMHDLPREAKGRVTLRDLATIPGATETLKLYDSEVYRGKVPSANWKRSAVEKGYNWRYDPWKFCRQALIPLHAAAHPDCEELLCWLDGDVITTAPVPPGLIEGLMPAKAGVAYLGREPKHSEIGFQLYRIPQAIPMLVGFSHLYTSGEIVKRKEWHSAYAFDIAKNESGIRAHNLTPGGTGNVWQVSPLQRYMTHNKGDRKLDAQRQFYAGAQL